MASLIFLFESCDVFVFKNFLFFAVPSLGQCIMLLRSMKNKTEKATPAPRQLSQPPPPSAASFFSVLDIILQTQQAESIQLIPSNGRKELRLTCTAAKSVIDAHVVKLLCVPSDEVVFDDPSSWPWPNLREINSKGANFTEQNMEDLVALALPYLKILNIICENLLLLSRSNWPELESLVLYVQNRQSPDDLYPDDFQLPKWPLKKLKLSVDNWQKVNFLPPLLKSCSALECLDIFNPMGSPFNAEAASMVTSEPFKQLEELILIMNEVEEDFIPTLFAKEWTALKKLNISSPVLPHTFYP
jgi:hypothetical protein